MCEAGDDGGGLQAQFILMGPGLAFPQSDAAAIHLSAPSLAAGLGRCLQIAEEGRDNTVADDEFLALVVSDDVVLQLLEGSNLLLD